MTTSRTGQCRCGEIRFEVKGRPLITMACHCTGCQSMTASAHSSSELHPASAFEVTAGALHSFEEFPTAGDFQRPIAAYAEQ